MLLIKIEVSISENYFFVYMWSTIVVTLAPLRRKMFALDCMRAAAQADLLARMGRRLQSAVMHDGKDGD